ncbi:PP2C family protein-serine/threonine phosphatase [Nocardioides donggukensis]|uniref:Serine/threonine-protein phosphatase n=1 Tax=Nocardioides donggukensis TaxID=2774019 RepID=A0A927K5T6_9ACTN|nr:PP2C family protein-serine/threonine phosphatase [Nocardioides donggukensis]MBD8870348.1 serine/threonine-protein phosphatase [Nocardioides donggukensis]
MPSARHLSDAWRSGTNRSQSRVLLVLIVCTMGSFFVSMARYDLFPLAHYFLWLLLGMVLLRFGRLLVLTAVIVGFGLVATMAQVPITASRVSAVMVFLVGVGIVLFVSSRQRSGLPGPLSSALLADLRDRLTAQGAIPTLPEQWHAQSAMVGADDVGYAGDFMVAELTEEGQRLEIVLVDVMGKGVAAAPSALLFAGALGGLVGTLRGERLMDAANEFLLRQDSEETFATAVHLSLDLSHGSYTILSAGHPPALSWSPAAEAWAVDNSRGLALGVLPHPELNASHGVIEAGGALLFHTDGVVESRGADIEDGIDWLRLTAREAIAAGFPGAARRIIERVKRGDDDRAVLILSRA